MSIMVSRFESQLAEGLNASHHIYEKIILCLLFVLMVKKILHDSAISLKCLTRCFLVYFWLSLCYFIHFFILKFMKENMQLESVYLHMCDM